MIRFTSRILSFVFLLTMTAGLSHNVFAATAAGVAVDNTATISYQINGNAMPTKTATAQFLVDRKIDLTVVQVDGGIVNVTPGDQNKVLTFTVKNTGNAMLDFTLSTLHNAAALGSLTESFDAANVRVFVESEAVANGYQDGVDAATYIDDLAAGASKTVYVVSNIPNTTINDDASTIDLVVQAADSSGSLSAPGNNITSDSRASVDIAGTVQNVFADAAGTGSGDIARDGKNSDKGTYRVQSAILTVSKTTTVLSDPVSGTTYPKAIPGAVIQYMILISNASTAGAPATNISVTDDLTSEIGTIEYNTNSIKVKIAGVETSRTDEGSDDGGDFGITALNTITVTGITLAANESAGVTFEVTIQ